MSYIFNNLDKAKVNSLLSQVFSPESVIIVHRKSPSKWMTYKDLGRYAKKHGNREIHHGLQWWAHGVQFDKDGVKNRGRESAMWCVFDFDSKDDIEIARKDAIKLVEFYIDKFGRSILSDGSVRIFFSGKKGFHVQLNPRSMFLGTVGSVEKDVSLRELMGYYVGYISSMLKMSTVDNQIYRRDGTIRMVNSCRREKFDISGRKVDQYKIEISLDELSDLSMPEVRDMATEPRNLFFSDEEMFSVPINLHFIDHAYNILQSWIQLKNAKAKTVTKLRINDRDKGKLPMCLLSLHNMNLDGRRNNAVVAYVCFMKNANWTMDEAADQIEKFTEDISSHVSGQKLKERQVQGLAAVKTIYSSDQYNFGCGAVMGIDGLRGGQPAKPDCAGSSCPFIAPESVDHQNPEYRLATMHDACLHTEAEKVQTGASVVSTMNEYQSVPTTVDVDCGFHHVNNRDATKHCGSCAFQKNVRYGLKKDISRGDLRYTDNGCFARRGMHDSEIVNLSNVKPAKRDRVMASHMFVHKECTEHRVKVRDFGRMFTFYASSDDEFDKLLSIDMVFQGKRLEVKEQKCIRIIRKGRSEVVYGSQALPEMKFGDSIKMVVQPIERAFGDLVLVVDSLERSSTELENFQVDESVVSDLKMLQEMNPDEPKTLLRMASTMEKVTGIFYRPFTSMCVAIAFHSTFSLSLPKIIGGSIFEVDTSDEENTEKGMIDMLILGDPGEGKTTIMRRMIEWLGMGDLVNGPNASVAGLIGGVRTDGTPFIRWGILPRQHGRIVAIDEFNNMPESVFPALTFVRSEGIARIEKLESGQTQARVRLITMANVKGSAEKGISDLSSYNNGCEAIKDLIPNPQDIRRYDIVAINRKGGKEADIPLSLAFKADTYPQNLSRTLLSWCWTRKSSEIIWSTESVVTLEGYYLHMKKVLNCDIPLAEQHVLRNRIGRMAQSIAGIMISTDASYDQIIVKPKHVTLAASMLWHMLCENNGANLNLYAFEYQKIQFMSGDDSHWVNEEFERMETMSQADPSLSHLAFAKERFFAVMRGDQFTRKGLQEEMELDDDMFRDFFTELRNRMMVRSKRSGGATYFRPSPKINRYVREEDQKQVVLESESSFGTLTEMLLESVDDIGSDDDPVIEVEDIAPPHIMSLFKND